MQKITPAEMPKLRLKTGRPTRNERVYQQLFMLEVGEVLHVTHRDWKTKTKPYWTVNRVAHFRGSKAKFSCKTLHDGRGWLITRIK
jgi:hypothetical protein